MSTARIVLISRLLLAVATTSTFAQPPSAPLLIRDVRLFDGTQVFQHRSVLVANGTIVRIGDGRLNIAGARIVSGEGRTLLPGLIDAHVHIPREAREALRQALVLGVTTELDMYSSPDKLPAIKALEAADLPDLSDVRTAGMGATVPGGHPNPPGGGGNLPTLTEPDQAQAFVDARLAEGSDYIKVILDDFREFNRHIPTLDDPTLRAIVKAAHLRGKMVIAHVLTANYAKEAIEADVDGLAHMYEGALMDEDFVFLPPGIISSWFPHFR